MRSASVGPSKQTELVLRALLLRTAKFAESDIQTGAKATGAGTWPSAVTNFDLGGVRTALHYRLPSSSRRNFFMGRPPP